MTKKSEKTQQLKEYIFLGLILFLACFFAFFKIREIPPGTQNDVLRSELAPELYLNGLDNATTGLRQKTAYFINGGYWSYFATDVLRGSLDVPTITIIGRLPAALFFIFTTIVWYRILKIIKLSNFARIIFFLVYIPSAAYITLSHHIPLVGGYFFFSSASVLYVLRFLSSERNKYLDLFLAFFCAGLATYTHGISVFFSAAIFGSLFLSFLLFKGDIIDKKLERFGSDPLKNTIKSFLIGIAFTITLIPLFDGIIYSDQSLQIPKGNTIKYLIDQGEADKIIPKTFKKIAAYLHPNTLVFSGRITSTKSDKNIAVPDIKNAQNNQWVTTNLSPFGVISAACYIGIIYQFFTMFTTKKSKYILVICLFFAFLVTPLFSNYDNPSIPKVLPAIMFIPLSISILSEDILSSDKKRLLQGVQLLIIIANIVYNLSYLYSYRYKENEIGKYYIYNYPEAIHKISDYIDFKKARIYLDTANPEIKNIFSYYLSPYILNRIVIGEIRPDIIKKEEQNFIFTHRGETVESLRNAGFSLDTTTYKTPSGLSDLILIEMADNIGKEIGNYQWEAQSAIVCTSQYYYPQFKGENEALLSHYRYYPNSHLYTTSDKCSSSSVKQYKLMNPGKLDYSNGTLTTTLADNFFGKYLDIPSQPQTVFDKQEIERDFTRFINTSNKTITYSLYNSEEITGALEIHTEENAAATTDTIKLTASSKYSGAAININAQDRGAGTYLVEFDYEIDSFAHFDFFINNTTADTHTGIPVTLPPQNYEKDYGEKHTTIFYLPEQNSYTMAFHLHNTHVNINQNDHPVEMDIKNLRIIKLTELNLFEDTAGFTPQLQPAKKKEEVGESQVFPGVMKISTSAKEDLIYINRPFSKNYKVFNNKFQKISSDNLLINGSAMAIDIKPEDPSTLDNDFYIINTSVIYGIEIFILFMGMLGFFSLANLDFVHIYTKKRAKQKSLEKSGSRVFIDTGQY